MTNRPSLTVSLEPVATRSAQVMTLSGKLLGTPEAYEFLEETRERIQAGRSNVYLEMSRVEMINSSGAGILAAITMSARRQGGKLVLVALQDRCRRILEFMCLQQVVVFADTLGDLAES
ncbi:MAG: STAS domain-containing protein [Candidatus Krumholzibacteriia bacterium]